MNVEPPETLAIIESIVYKSNGFAIFTLFFFHSFTSFFFLALFHIFAKVRCTQFDFPKIRQYTYTQKII